MFLQKKISVVTGSNSDIRFVFVTQQVIDTRQTVFQLRVTIRPDDSLAKQAPGGKCNSDRKVYVSCVPNIVHSRMSLEEAHGYSRR